MREFIYDVGHPGQLVRRALAGWRTRDYWRDPERACGFVSAVLGGLTILLGVQAIVVVQLVDWFA